MDYDGCESYPIPSEDGQCTRQVFIEKCIVACAKDFDLVRYGGKKIIK